LLGGAKVSDKIEVIENLLPRVDALLIGGAWPNTSCGPRAAPGRAGRGGQGELARELMAGAGPGHAIRLPVDHVVAPRFKEDAHGRRYPWTRYQGWWASTSDRRPPVPYADEAAAAELVLLERPMGVFE